MYRTKLMTAAVLGATLGAASFSVEAQQKYRWIDDNGTVRVADRIPPDVTGNRIEVLNARGIVVRVIPADPTDEERAALELAAHEAEQARVTQAAQARRDRMLLDSYTSVDDLMLARDARLSSLEAQIRVSRDAAENLERAVDDLATRVEHATNPAPALLERLAATREQLEATQRFLETREQEQVDIREQFEADIARFERLRNSGEF